ncbi:unnamed protein product, partial [Effrenium voratum]
AKPIAEQCLMQLHQGDAPEPPPVIAKSNKAALKRLRQQLAEQERKMRYMEAAQGERSQAMRNESQLLADSLREVGLRCQMLVGKHRMLLDDRHQIRSRKMLWDMTEIIITSHWLPGLIRSNLPGLRAMFAMLALALFTCARAAEFSLVGLGTAGIKEVSTMVAALEMGYRTLDTALLYGNHDMVRHALERSTVPREEVFLTSKVGFFPSSMKLPEELRPAFGMEELPIPQQLRSLYHPLNQKGKEVQAVELSLKELGVEYLDLCLIHSPATSALELTASFWPHLYGLWQGHMASWTEGTTNGALKALAMQEVKQRSAAAYAERKRSWQGMEEAKRRGLCRHIGVSNYPVAFMKEIDEYKSEPIFNEQQELHPLAQFRDVQ